MIQLHIQSETIQGNLSQESGGQALGDNPLFGHFLSGLMELPGDQNFEEVNTLYRKGFIHFELNLISKEQMDQLETDVEEGLQQNPLNLMSTGSMFTSFEEENTQRKEVLPFGDFNLESGSAPSFLNAILSDFKPTESRFEAVTMGSENEEMEGVANRVLQKMAGLMNALTDFKLESPMGEGDRAEFVVQGFQLRWSELKISLSDSLSDLPKNSEKLALVETNKEEAFLEESNPLQLGIQNWIIEWKGTEQEQH